MALNQFLESEHRNFCPSSTLEGTKMKVAVQGRGETEEPIVLWRLALDAPQTVSREITDSFRLHQA